MVRVSGYGQTGPYSSQPGFGTLIEAMSGFAHLTGQPDGSHIARCRRAGGQHTPNGVLRGTPPIVRVLLGPSCFR